MKLHKTPQTNATVKIEETEKELGRKPREKERKSLQGDFGIREILTQKYLLQL